MVQHNIYLSYYYTCHCHYICPWYYILLAPSKISEIGQQLYLWAAHCWAVLQHWWAFPHNYLWAPYTVGSCCSIGEWCRPERRLPSQLYLWAAHSWAVLQHWWAVQRALTTWVGWGRWAWACSLVCSDRIPPQGTPIPPWWRCRQSILKKRIGKK